MANVSTDFEKKYFNNNPYCPKCNCANYLLIIPYTLNNDATAMARRLRCRDCYCEWEEILSISDKKIKPLINYGEAESSMFDFKLVQ